MHSGGGLLKSGCALFDSWVRLRGLTGHRKVWGEQTHQKRILFILVTLFCSILKYCLPLQELLPLYYQALLVNLHLDEKKNKPVEAAEYPAC